MSAFGAPDGVPFGKNAHRQRPYAATEHGIAMGTDRVWIFCDYASYGDARVHAQTLALSPHASSRPHTTHASAHCTEQRV